MAAAGVLAVIATLASLSPATGSVTGGTTTDGADGPVVRTETGLVRGVREDEHTLYHGIPYAGPPTGSHRWAAPRPAAHWAGVRDATKPGPLCPQVPAPHAPISGSDEDCLVLNVTAPSSRPRGGAPVLVWIHGDGAVGGGAFYDGRRLAAQGLVVVTVNYRLGVFGSFAHPGLEGSGTFGLQDQQAALAWVRRNAGAFGGNPRNVTVAGVSFGASAIAGHLTSPGARGLFDRAVMMSGAGMMDMPAGAMGPEVPGYPWFVWRTGRQMRDIGAAMTAPLGCRHEDPDRALACLRALPVRMILDVPAIMNAHQGFAFGNRTLPRLPEAALREGRFHRVPVLSGATRDEHRLFVGARYDAVGKPFTEDDYRKALDTAFGDLAGQVLAAYPAAAFASPALAWATVVTDRMWARGTYRQHTALGRHVPVYAYEFADREAPMYLPFPGGFDFGAYHAADPPYLFEDDAAEPLFTPGQKRLSAAMARSWAAFARTGDPNVPGLPAWRPYRPGDPTPVTQSLAPHRTGPVDYRREHRLGFWNRLR